MSDTSVHFPFPIPPVNWGIRKNIKSVIKGKANYQSLQRIRARSKIVTH